MVSVAGSDPSAGYLQVILTTNLPILSNPYVILANLGGQNSKTRACLIMFQPPQMAGLSFKGIYNHKHWGNSFFGKA